MKEPHKLTDRELATVLVALRHWQRFGIYGAEQHDIATNGGEFDPLTTDEIDDLCEYLNT